MKKFLLGTGSSDVAALAARISLAVLLFPHGAQKVMGWYGGYGFEGTMNFFTAVKHIPYLIGLMVIIAEFVGPFALIAGIASRWWALLIIADMIGIIFSSHTQYGFFMNWFGNQKGEGFEYHLAIIALAMTLVIYGAGRYSVDRWLLSKKSNLIKNEK